MARLMLSIVRLPPPVLRPGRLHRDLTSASTASTPGAGDAIAANTVMQMVDPWQYGVQDTDLQRAGRPRRRQGGDAAADSAAG